MRLKFSPQKTPNRSSKKRKKVLGSALTLVEILVVIVLLAAITGFFTPKLFRQYKAYHALQEVRAVESLLGQARVMSGLAQSDITLVFDRQEKNSWSITLKGCKAALFPGGKSKEVRILLQGIHKIIILGEEVSQTKQLLIPYGGSKFTVSRTANASNYGIEIQ